MSDFATVKDLEAYWRPLTSDENRRAAKLLEYASAKIRQAAPSVDADIAAGTVQAIAAELVAVAMVKRALVVPSDGVTQTTDTTGPFSESTQWANPMGNLYLTRDEVRSLGGYSRGKAFTVDALPNPGPLIWPDDYTALR